MIRRQERETAMSLLKKIIYETKITTATIAQYAKWAFPEKKSATPLLRISMEIPGG